ncbi:MAG: FAD-dependent monooxygenase [Sphingomonadales bacterium]|nr:FAD-dependent monooxygenase [Sphingomonadales bacterium]
MQDILISGASITGPALAWWLERAGFRPVLVERTPGRARGGHAIDVRGAALRVLEAMGLAAAARASAMRMKGVSVVDDHGQELWRSEEMTISGGRFDNPDIEILRDRLSHVLVDALSPPVEIRYGDSIAALQDDGAGVDVTFASGHRQRFDLVIGAEGLRSQVRRLVFGEDKDFLRSFGIALAPFSAPNTLGLEDWQISYKGSAGGYMVYTTPENDELRVCFNVPATLDDNPGGRDEQMALIRAHTAGLQWETPRFLEAMAAAPDFYLGLIAQVRMPRWSTGRVALVGDAGYCPSPFTGQGATLALVGAQVLATELSRTPDDHVAAFSGYETRMRPFVEANQAIADLTTVPEFSEDPEYYARVVEPVLDKAKFAIELEGLD